MAIYLGSLIKLALDPIVFIFAFVAYKIATRKKLSTRLLIYTGVGLFYILFHGWISTAASGESIQISEIIRGVLAFTIDLGLILLLVKIINIFRSKKQGLD